MAKSPRPGVGKRAERTDAAQQILRITIRGESWDLCAGNLPITERFAVREAAGTSLERLMEPLEVDSVIVLWWLARRASGEPTLRLTVADAEWRAMNLVPDDVTVEEIDPDDDDDLVDSPES